MGLDLQALLQASQGNSSGLTGSNTPATPTDMSQQQPGQQDQPQPQQPPPANNAQNAGPVKAGLRSVLSGMLKTFSYGAGQSMVKAAGGETDAEQQTRMATTAHINAQTAMTNAQVQQMQNTVPFQMPNGAVLHLPVKMATDLAKQQLANQGKVDAKRFMAVPNVGLVDTQHPSGSPTVVQGTTPTSVTVTPEIAQQYNIPQQLIGKALPLQNFVGLERGGAAWAGNVSNTTETKEVSDPNNPGSTMLVKVPKTTSTQKVAPGASSAQGATTQAGQRPAGTLGTVGGVRTIVGQDGQPLQGKGGIDTVYATDPKTGQQVFTTRTEAANQGLQTPMKVTASQARKDQALSNRVADVQRKVGDYADTFSQPLDSADKVAISYLMDHNIGGGLSAGGLHVNLLPGYVQSQLQAAGIGKLSENGMKRFIQFNQARESLSGYQQVLTNSSKSSDEILDLQLEQLPPPIADEQYANMATGEFQKNIDLAGQHIPMFPGSAETQQSIKAQQMAKRAQDLAVKNNQNNPQQYIDQNKPGGATKFYQGVPYTQGSDGQWHKASK